MKIYKELESLGFFKWLSETHNLSDTDIKPEYLDKLPLNDIHRTVSNAMAFRWFRDKYNLFGCIDLHSSFPIHWYIRIDDIIINDYIYHSEDENLKYNTFEEAELDCLKKLIQIVKESK